MIYTSYFAKLRKLPKNIIPISICGKAPDWYTGLQYKKLAPTYDILMKYKQDGDKEYYTKHFQKEVLDKLNVNNIKLELYEMIHDLGYEDEIICLVCFEKPSDFCHRHLVAQWLNDNGIKCEEWSE